MFADVRTYIDVEPACLRTHQSPPVASCFGPYDLIPSLQHHYGLSWLLRIGPPQCSCIGTLASRVSLQDEIESVTYQIGSWSNDLYRFVVFAHDIEQINDWWATGVSSFHSAPIKKDAASITFASFGQQIRFLWLPGIKSVCYQAIG
jgi:hypothetical protein